MTKKFKVGDHVLTKSDGIYQKSQQSLNGHVGTVVDVDDYPHNIHVRVESIKGHPIIEFSESELSIREDVFTVEKGIEIQTRQLNEWKKILKKGVYEELVKYATEKNHEAKNGWEIRRGSDLNNFVANFKKK